MPVTINDVKRLSIDERIELAEEIWDTIAEEQASLELTDAQSDELRRRVALYESNRDNVIPWEQVKEQALRRARP